MTVAFRRPRSAPGEAEAIARFAADVEACLSRNPRQLPSRYFYDSLGSTLFDAICLLPWYPITRAELRLLRARGADLLRRVEPLGRVVELGPGSGEKLRALLDRRRAGRALEVHLVDVSARALQLTADKLRSLPDLHIVLHPAEYDVGLAQAASGSGQGRTLVLFLGSNIGNFDPPRAAALLSQMRDSLAPDDVLLLGTDLVKPERDLLLAYDDPLGITAAFNRNLLVRINRELGGTFEVGQFEHRARWNSGDLRMEMHLVARSTQHVHIGAIPMDLTVRAGEGIWTESSYKYTPDSVRRMVEAAGFRTIDQPTDDAEGFMLTLAEAV